MNELRRRKAFYRNLEYSLDQMYDEVQSRKGDKWFNVVDKAFLIEFEQYLGSALKVVRTRYIQVLSDQITEWDEKVSG